MQQLVVEKVWEREFDLRSRRRTSIYFICGLYLVAAISIVLVSLVSNQEPAYSMGQQIGAAILFSACAFAASWRVAEFWAAHLIVIAMFGLFFFTAFNDQGVNTPIASLLPLVPVMAAVLLGAKASAIYLCCVLIALIVLLLGSPGSGVDAVESFRALALVFGSILVAGISAYIVSLNERLVQALKSKGGYDEVTNLPNRYYIRDWLNQLFESEKISGSGSGSNSGKPIAVLCIGIDSFAEMNEKHGNQRGDEAMSHAAHALQKVVNKNGSVIVRNRGNSFIAAMSGASIEDARKTAEKAQQAVAALKISGVASKYMTVSVGIVTTTIGNDDKTAFGLIELAVSQMHLAQALGAGKISTSDETKKDKAYTAGTSVSLD